MAYKVTVQMDNRAKGDEIEIPGLGVFENGSTTTLTDEQVATYRQLHSRYVQDFDDDGNPVGEAVWTEGSVEDINTYGVEVTEFEPPKPNNPPPQKPEPTAGGLPVTTEGGDS